MSAGEQHLVGGAGPAPVGDAPVDNLGVEQLGVDPAEPPPADAVDHADGAVEEEAPVFGRHFFSLRNFARHFMEAGGSTSIVDDEVGGGRSTADQNGSRAKGTLGGTLFGGW